VASPAADLEDPRFFRGLHDARDQARGLTQPLRDQTPAGIVNCHGALLPRYRGLMPSFWTLANGETEGGVSVHFVDAKLDNGPIVVQKSYRIHKHDTLEDVMAGNLDPVIDPLIREHQADELRLLTDQA
jgi:methionyl-tRNA formyltransferase